MPKKHPSRLFLRIFYHPCGLLVNTSPGLTTCETSFRPCRQKNKVSQILRYLVLLSGLSFISYLFVSCEQIFSVCFILFYLLAQLRANLLLLICKIIQKCNAFNKNTSSEILDTSYEQEHHVPARCILSHILTKAV